MVKKILVASSCFVALSLSALNGSEAAQLSWLDQPSPVALQSFAYGALFGFFSNVFVHEPNQVMIANGAGALANGLLQGASVASIQAYNDSHPPISILRDGLVIDTRISCDEDVRFGCNWSGYLVGALCGRVANQLCRSIYSMIAARKAASAGADRRGDKQVVVYGYYGPCVCQLPQDAFAENENEGQTEHRG